MKDIGLWLRYYTIWPGLEQLGEISHADAAIGLAFGRNALPDEERHTIGQEVRDRFDGDEIKAISSFKRRIGIGEPNYRIAAEITRLLNRWPIPALVQWEIALGFDFPWFVEHAARITILWPPVESRQSFNAHDVLLEAQSARSFARPAIVTHQRLVVRAVLLAKKLGMNPVVCPNSITCFDWRSVQPWTAGAMPWLWREVRARGHHIKHGWV